MTKRKGTGETTRQRGALVAQTSTPGLLSLAPTSKVGVAPPVAPDWGVGTMQRQEDC